VGPGVLYLVATPIGNLEDVTLRALRVLRMVDWIAAEDTRRTSILLQAHGIEKALTAYHAHNERERTPGLLVRLRSGESGALVTDAGTPGISDPGFYLSRAARDAGIRIEVIPGPSAVLTAILLSGLPCEAFCFLGYPPPKGAARRRFLEMSMGLDRTVVLFEGPHRVIRFMEEVVLIDPSRPMALCREMTKKFEEVLRGTSQELLEEVRRRPRKGEFTIVISAVPSRTEHA
jgi:16S rRNA (cytidine1402-2'-O)-methyltransferase